MTIGRVEEGEEYPEFIRGYRVVFECDYKKPRIEYWGAYVPDLPGCVAAAETRRDVKNLITVAIDLHLEGIKLEGE